MFVAVLSDNPESREAFCKAAGKEISRGDVALYSMEEGGKRVVLIDPISYPEKVQPLLYSLSMADAFVLMCDALSPKVGELIVALNSIKADKGFVLSKVPLPLGGTSLERFEKVADADALKGKLLSLQGDDGEDLVALVERTEAVKSVGNVAHGVLKSGTLKKSDKFFLLPKRSDVEVRSFTVGGADAPEVAAGAPFSMAYKGELIDRGLLVPLRYEHEIGNVINGRFIRSPFFKDELKGKIHAYTNMQYVEGNLNESDITLKEPIAFEKGELILIVDASNQKLRIAGAFQSKW